MKRGSIDLARRLCYEIAGPTDEEDDMSGSDYGSVDIAEILSAEVERLRAAICQTLDAPEIKRQTIQRGGTMDDAARILEGTREILHPEFKLGDFEFTHLRNGKIWIRYKTGEGGEFNGLLGGV